MNERLENAIPAGAAALTCCALTILFVVAIDPFKTQSVKETVYRLTVDRTYGSPGRDAHSTVTTYPDLMTEAACLQAMYGHIKVMEMPYYRVEGLCTNMKTGEVLSEVSENNPDQKNP